jgi:hypothetical protein
MPPKVEYFYGHHQPRTLSCRLEIMNLEEDTPVFDDWIEGCEGQIHSIDVESGFVAFSFPDFRSSSKGVYRYRFHFEAGGVIIATCFPKNQTIRVEGSLIRAGIHVY